MKINFLFYMCYRFIHKCETPLRLWRNTKRGQMCGIFKKKYGQNCKLNLIQVFTVTEIIVYKGVVCNDWTQRLQNLLIFSTFTQLISHSVKWEWTSDCQLWKITEMEAFWLSNKHTSSLNEQRFAIRFVASVLKVTMFTYVLCLQLHRIIVTGLQTRTTERLVKHSIQPLQLCTQRYWLKSVTQRQTTWIQTVAYLVKSSRQQVISQQWQTEQARKENEAVQLDYLASGWRMRIGAPAVKLMG